MEVFYQQFTRERQYLQNVSLKTVEAYKWAWKAFEPVLKGRVTIAKGDLVSHVAALRTRGLSPVTVNTYSRSLNAFFRWMHQEGHTEMLTRIPKLKEESKRIQIFSPQQIAALVSFRPASPAEQRIHLLTCLILDTGLRVDEALCITRADDVDLGNLLLKVRQGKGSKERIVPTSIPLRRMLARYMQRHRPEYGDLLFFASRGDKVSQRNALRDFKAICDRLGITGVRCSFHTLRHTFATAYLRNGGDVFRLQRILGHAKLEMTRRYVSLETSDLQAVHNRLSLLTP